MNGFDKAIFDALQAAQGSAFRALQVNFIEGLQGAVREGATQSLQMKALAKAFGADMIPADMRQNAFEKLGKLGQNSVRQAYTHRANRRRPAWPGYRLRTSRNANGALLRAIGDSDFYRASPNGLQFINRDMLDDQASHWRRLNFGAGARAGSQPRRFRFDMLAQASFGLDPDPQPGFKMPPGVFLNGSGNAVRFSRENRGQHGFTPRRGSGKGSAVFETRGIRATNFLDAGVRRLANELGPTLFALYGRFFNDRELRDQFTATFNAPPPRPRMPRFNRQR